MTEVGKPPTALLRGQPLAATPFAPPRLSLFADEGVRREDRVKKDYRVGLAGERLQLQPVARGRRSEGLRSSRGLAQALEGHGEDRPV